MTRNVVGARELKTRLGTYLQRVREGRTLVVTDRGEPVAELRPLPSDKSLPSALLKLSTRPLRSGDAVQLASCLYLQRETGQRVLFTAFDERLNNAAGAEGLTFASFG